MPMYEYRCNACDHLFEELVPRITDKKFPCPKCHSQDTQKLISAAGINTHSFKEPACAATCPSAGSSCCSGGTCGLHH